MKKAFPCGHIGKGKYCHRCKQEKTEKQVEDNTSTVLYQVNPVVSDKILSDHGIPGLKAAPKATQAKAIAIVSQVRLGVPLSRFRGQRLQYDRSIISIPIGYSWRLVYVDNDGDFEVKGLFSHEEYNNRFSGG